MPEANDNTSGARQIAPASERSDDRVRLTPIGACGRLSLRLPPDVAATLGSVGGFEIDIPINRCVASSEQVSARLGPDEWLLIAPASEGPDLERKVAGALGEVFCSVVDISHRNLAISVEGSRSRDVINSGCPLDLSDVAFPEGNATRTILGKAEIVLLRPAGQRAYRVECWRSFMPYVADFLRQGAREFAPHQSDRRQ